MCGWVNTILIATTYVSPMQTAHYMFRLGEGCSHIAAILLKIGSAVRNGHCLYLQW